MVRFKSRASLIFIFCIVFIGGYTYLNLAKWRIRGVIVADSISYYAYLPAVFVYHDLSLGFLDKPDCPKEVEMWPEKTADGKKIIKTSMGMALFYAPLFFIAQAYAHLTHTSVSGYSPESQLIVGFCALLYLFLGLLILRKILLRYFTERITLWALMVLCLATNLLFYFTVDTMSAHIIGFFLVNVFIWYTLRWQDNPKTRYVLALGLCLGLLTLVRPTNILVVLIFLFYTVKDRTTFKTRIRLLLSHARVLWLIPALTILVFLPQLLYWHMQTGHYFFNSYVGEGFFFNKPHIMEGLFGFRKGWFVYTPAMLLFAAGLFFMRDALSVWRLPILLFFVIITWVLFSWWCWWYGGSFGARVYIDFYALFALPIAAVLQAVYNSGRKKMTIALITLCTVFALLNGMQSYQAKANIIHYDSMTWEKYRTDFFWMGRELDHHKELLRAPDYEKAKREGE